MPQCLYHFNRSINVLSLDCRVAVVAQLQNASKNRHFGDIKQCHRRLRLSCEQSLDKRSVPAGKVKLAIDSAISFVGSIARVRRRAVDRL